MAAASHPRSSDPAAPASTPPLGQRHALHASRLDLPNRRQGKVRDVYDLPGEGPDRPGRLLIVASDRISAYDVVMPTPIAGKGRLLTEISSFWFRFIEAKRLTPTHWLSDKTSEIPAGAFSPGGTTRADLEGRIAIGRRCKVVPIECVVRGYLEGSGWKDYLDTGSVCGVKLPERLRQCDKLPEPIFTPATKAPQGEHDENISFDRACELVGRRTMETLRDRTLAIYRAASEHALSRGIIIADTKFEFGVPVDGGGGASGDGEPILIDEALTPDSSRFWPVEGYTPGQPQKSFDKQYLREYLQSLVDKGQWNKQSPGPELPAEVIERTVAKYAEARDRLCR